MLQEIETKKVTENYYLVGNKNLRKNIVLRR